MTGDKFDARERAAHAEAVRGLLTTLRVATIELASLATGLDEQLVALETGDRIDEGELQAVMDLLARLASIMGVVEHHREALCEATANVGKIG